MKVAIYTLGCKVNQYETQAMEQELRSRGHEVVEFSAEADAYVVNSCSVTAVSDQKSRQMLHRIRRQHPGAVAALAGCYPQTHVEDVQKLDVDLIAGTGDRMKFLDLLEEAVAERKHIESIDKAFERRVFEVLPAGGMSERTRAMLKVEDGCVNFCTYCIIPYARGPVRSLPLEKAAEQAAELKSEGYKEIVLTGIEISSWGKDLKNGLSLIDLMEVICRAAPGIRIRLGSLEPRTITEDFCRRAAALPMLCPQFHLSMQSGCDATLKRMNRKYDTARYAQSVALLNQYFTQMGKCISKNHGVINKYIGDAVMAIFGVPVKSKNHALDAYNACIEMKNSLKDLNETFAKNGLPQISFGIGLHSGSVLAGNIGAENRMEYTVIGDTVNTASRIESLCKVYNTDLLISETTLNKIFSSKENINFNFVADAEIRGKTETVKLYSWQKFIM